MSIRVLFPGDPVAEVDPVPSGFNWGAFLFAPLFLLWYQRAGTALLLFGVGAIAPHVLGDACAFTLMLPVSISVGMHFGRHANEVAWETERFDTYAELQSSMRRWNIAGLVALGLLGIRVVVVHYAGTWP
jgi:hypothetical protein